MARYSAGRLSAKRHINKALQTRAEKVIISTATQ